MDRPPEGSLPEQPVNLSDDGAEAASADRSDRLKINPQRSGSGPDNTGFDNTGFDRLAAAQSPSSSRWQRPLERIDIHELEPTRTVIFRRIDPKKPSGGVPHFDPAEELESSGDNSAGDVSLPVAIDAFDDLSADQTLHRLDRVKADRDRPPSESRAGESASNTNESSQVSPPGRSHHHRPHRNESLRQSLMMLATVIIMLAAARFVLPGIVEEIRYAQHRGQLRAEFEVAGEGLKNVSLDTLSQAYEMVNAAAGPSVVHIDIHRSGDESIRHPDIPGAPSILISDQGSGVVVDAAGYILTNRHVVASSDGISVTLSDGRTVDSVVVGTDEMTDLAVLKVDVGGLIPIPWGDSEKIRVGSPVWAIGSPFGLDRTVTFGILSGKHRVVRAKDRYQDFMQSDVAVNPGNSGGPLVDSRGTLIGINTAIVGDTYQGVSFAIPSGIAKKIYQQLREKGSIQRGWLGVSLVEVPDDRLPGTDHRMRGAMIASLADLASGAARAGLEPGDLVVGLDDEKVRNVDHLMQLIGNAMAGTGIHLSVIRNDQPMEFNVLLGLRPEAIFQRE